MNKEQAHIFFPHSSEDDLDDLWEQRLFEQKQFFLTRPPIRKVWEGRLNRLAQQHQAYLTLTEQSMVDESPLDITQKQHEFPDDFIAAFHAFHTLRNQHKSKVLQAQNLHDLNNSVHQWLNTEGQFAKHWSHPASEEDQIEVVRGKEPDPMELLKELKKTAKVIDTTSLNVLKENYNNLSESVKKEVKRLTLLAKD